MKHTSEEILDALKVIKEVCEENKRCYSCPLHSYKDEWCNLKYWDAEDWDLNEGEDDRAWRAFR